MWRERSLAARRDSAGFGGRGRVDVKPVHYRKRMMRLFYSGKQEARSRGEDMTSRAPLSQTVTGRLSSTSFHSGTTTPLTDVNGPSSNAFPLAISARMNAGHCVQ